MFDLLVTPGAPWFALSLAGACLAAMGLAQQSWPGIGAPMTQAVRMGLGQIVALTVSGCLILVANAAGIRGDLRLLVLAGAVASYLLFGWVWPRAPYERIRRERFVLRRLTPGFVSFTRIALAGCDAPAVVLERYITRRRPQLYLMQQVVAAAIAIAHAERLRPFEALRRVARQRGCRELIDVAETLAQAEAQGSDAAAALAAHQETLEAILRDEFVRMMRRRALYLLGLAAISLIVGVLGNILFVMTAGGSLLQHLQ
ncbi:MAG TPA: hypothetical protein PKA05_08000 [Roseiflexaceae bacterium]|nr:hypothetical protein [Roseiflexaceae bacterium]HMP40306.1 hypothetical protein [Roseiflexaceae bacterium]